MKIERARNEAIMTQTRITAMNIRQRKGETKNPKAGKIVAVTAYDFTFAKLVDSHVDIVLVGDSLGMVIQGHPNTLSVTVEDMIYHSRAVHRGLKTAHLVVDMPFMSYQAGVQSAIRNAGRLVQEGFAQSVKLEGGVNIAKTVEKLVDIGIPVMGHVGLTPQSVHQFGGYRIQGKSKSAKEAIMMDALALEDAGAYAIVLEGIPAELAAEITERITIPTIGIGAGAKCDGQVLVSQDLLGMDSEFRPRFVKQFANLSESVQGAVAKYANEVRSGQFPLEEHSFH